MAPNLSFGVTGCVMAGTLHAPFESPRACEWHRPQTYSPTRSAMDAMDVDCCELEKCWQCASGRDGGHPGAGRYGAHPSDYQPSTPALGRQLQTQSAGGWSGSSAASRDAGWLRGVPSTAPASPRRLRGAGGNPGDEHGAQAGGPGCTVTTGLSSRSSPDAFSMEQIRRANRIDR